MRPAAVLSPLICHRDAKTAAGDRASPATRIHLGGNHPTPRTGPKKLLPVVIGYVTAILIGLAEPGAAVALYFGLAVYLIVPFREVARLLVRRS